MPLFFCAFQIQYSMTLCLEIRSLLFFSARDMDIFESAFENWDFILYDCNVLGTLEYSMVPKNAKYLTNENHGLGKKIIKHVLIEDIGSRGSMEIVRLMSTLLTCINTSCKNLRMIPLYIFYSKCYQIYKVRSHNRFRIK